MTASPAPDPLMMRVYKDDKKGATAFFRNRSFLNVIVARLAALEAKPVNVLLHACSIGAEPYSVAAVALDRGLDIAIDTTDIEPDFIAAAQQARYPEIITASMTASEKKCFKPIGQGLVEVDAALRSMVNFLPAQSLTDPMPGTYDATLAMNVLTYLTPAGQSRAIAAMAAATAHYLCLTAFHPDSIKSDIESVGFEPVMDDQALIHNGWGARVRPGGAAPGTPEYSWVVPPYNADCDDYAWRYGAIFQRKK
jgi:chemotaxis methyl-accepting protein methylase